MKNKYEVTYHLPTTGAKRHKTTVTAVHQLEAKKLFEASMPSAQFLTARQLPNWHS